MSETTLVFKKTSLKSWKSKLPRFNKPLPLKHELIFPDSLTPLSPSETISDYLFPQSLSYMSLLLNSNGTDIGDSISSQDSTPTSEIVDLMEYAKQPKGPRIKPYIYSKLDQAKTPKVNKKLGLDNCFICDELIQTTLSEEKVLELDCGDCIHEQCLMTLVDCNVNQLLMTSKFTVVKSQLCSLILPKCYGKHCQQMGQSGENLIQFCDESCIDTIQNNCIAKSVEFDRDNLKDFLNPSINIPFRLSKGESMISDQPSFRSSSPSPTLSTTNTLKFSDYSSLTVDFLKDKLVRLMLNNCPSITLNTLFTMGELILADELLLKFEEHDDFKPQLCYLFNKKLVIWEATNQDFQILHLDNGFTFATPNPSILQITQNTIPKTNIWIDTDSSSIIEKWIIGLSDLSYKFPVEIITSTINIFEERSFPWINFEKPEPYTRLSGSTVSLPKANSNNSSTPSTLNQTTNMIDDDVSVTDSEYIDSDNEMIKDIMNDNNNKFPSPTISNYDSSLYDSDYDSDAIQIKSILNKHGGYDNLIGALNDEINRCCSDSTTV